jgi:predicted O-methyltransferase YrrM
MRWGAIRALGELAFNPVGPMAARAFRAIIGCFRISQKRLACVRLCRWQPILSMSESDSQGPNKVGGELSTSHINPALTEFGKKFRQTELDSITLEEQDFVYSLVRMRKPKLVIETGTGHAQGTRAIALALVAEHEGHLVTCDIDPFFIEGVRARLLEYIPTSIVDAFCAPGLLILILQSLDTEKPEFIFIDAGDAENRLREIEFIVKKDLLAPKGLLVIHDAINKGYKRLPEYMQAQGWPGLIFESLAGIAVFQHP